MKVFIYFPIITSLYFNPNQFLFVQVKVILPEDMGFLYTDKYAVKTSYLIF